MNVRLLTLVMLFGFTGCQGVPNRTISSSVSGAAGPAGSASASGSVPVRIGYGLSSSAYAPLWIAQDQGLFKRQGLTTEVMLLPPPRGNQALISGNIQLAIGGGDTIAAVANGANLTDIAETVQIYGTALYGLPSIQNVSDLIGKSVAASSKGGSLDHALRTLLAREGVDASKVNIVYLGDDANSLAALENNTIQAAMLTPPNTLHARQAGMRLVADTIPLKLHAFGSA